MSISLKAVPSYEKCFFDEDFDAKPSLIRACCLRGEEFHFEVVMTAREVPAWAARRAGKACVPLSACGCYHI